MTTRCTQCNRYTTTDPCERCTAGLAHGTNAGYYRHLNAGQKPCEPCRLAHNAYVHDYKARRRADEAARAAQEAADNALPTAAHNRALYILQQRHPDEYRVLYQRELRRLKEAA